MSGRRELQYGKGTSRKFWAIELRGNSHTVHFGRIGTAGQTQTKAFADKVEAKNSYDKLIVEKVKGGYREGKSVEEAEWLTGKFANKMLESLPLKLTPRKCRLYACACARRLWHLFTEKACKDGVVVAEQLADKLVGPARRIAARRAIGPTPGGLDTTKTLRVVARDALDANARWGALRVSNFAPLAVEFAKGAKAATRERT